MFYCARKIYLKSSEKHILILGTFITITVECFVILL